MNIQVNFLQQWHMRMNHIPKQLQLTTLHEHLHITHNIIDQQRTYKYNVQSLTTRQPGYNLIEWINEYTHAHRTMLLFVQDIATLVPAWWIHHSVHSVHEVTTDHWETDHGEQDASQDLEWLESHQELLEHIVVLESQHVTSVQ